MLQPEKNSGRTYEATYIGWLTFFEKLAKSSHTIVSNCPKCWTPFIEYMGHTVIDVEQWFEEDAIDWPSTLDLRRKVEISSVCRPELVHALYLYDTIWRFTYEKPSAVFTVTCNASFFRPEVLQFINRLHSWSPTYDRSTKTVIICPCAADKPYPAPLHLSLKKLFPEAYLIVSTGVLGLVPEDLWPVAPNYDAGLPNSVRVFEETALYFNKWPHKKPPVLYLDFNLEWTVRGLFSVGQLFKDVSVQVSENHYADLLSKENLASLAKVLCA